jgi:hypothetical protein
VANELIVSNLGPSRSTVLNGTTLISPTGYMSPHTASASNYCSPVGKTFSSTLLAVNATDVSKFTLEAKWLKLELIGMGHSTTAI